MVRFIFKRLGLALIALWLLGVLVFLLGQVLASDPERSMLGWTQLPPLEKSEPGQQIRCRIPLSCSRAQMATNVRGQRARVTD